MARRHVLRASLEKTIGRLRWLTGTKYSPNKHPYSVRQRMLNCLHRAKALIDASSE